MAFTNSQKVKLCKILGINAIQLDVQLAAYALSITAEMEADVIAEIARWEAGAGKRVWFEATESNEGFNMSGDITGGDPKFNIETLLFFEHSSASGTEFELVRG